MYTSTPSYEEEQRLFHLQQQQMAEEEQKMHPSDSDDRASPIERSPRGGRHYTARGRHPASTKHGRRKDPGASYYAYGTEAAIEFICDETRKQQVQTICMQAASAKGNDERGYEWENKTIIQIPRNELLQVTAIMLGKMAQAEFEHVSQYNTKRYAVAHQGGNVLFSIEEEGKPRRSVTLSPDDTYQVLALFLRQLKSNSSWMTVTEIIALIDQTVVAMRSGEELAAEGMETVYEEDETQCIDVADEAFDDDAYSEYTD
ncbi:MAG: hypothetical protein ACWA5X_07020 [bacterium]